MSALTQLLGQLNVAGQSVPILELIALGGGVGLVAGMFGVGGGFLLTPLLSVVFSLPLPIAVGTGLCQMIGTAVVALLRHRTLGQGEIRVDVMMFAGSFVGVGAGTQVVSQLEQAGVVALLGRRFALVNVVIYGAYIVLLAACSWLFWRQSGQAIDGLRARKGPLARLRLGPSINLPRVPLKDISAINLAYVGMFLGVLSGMLGIGGGVALMPILIYGYGFPIKQAAGTGILALLLTVTVGTVQHAWAGHVHLPMACILLVGSSISAQMGALLTRRLKAGQLRRTFAVLIWLTILAIAWDLSRAPRSSSSPKDSAGQTGKNSSTSLR